MRRELFFNPVRPGWLLRLVGRKSVSKQSPCLQAIFAFSISQPLFHRFLQQPPRMFDHRACAIDVPPLAEQCSEKRRRPSRAGKLLAPLENAARISQHPLGRRQSSSLRIVLRV